MCNGQKWIKSRLACEIKALEPMSLTSNLTDRHMGQYLLPRVFTLEGKRKEKKEKVTCVK